MTTDMLSGLAMKIDMVLHPWYIYNIKEKRCFLSWEGEVQKWPMKKKDSGSHKEQKAIDMSITIWDVDELKCHLWV